MSDLFDGVNPPREDRREAQQSAAAPAPAREAASTPKAGEKATGVPMARLWLWAVPLLLAVAAVALWSVSVWLLVAAAAAAILGVIVSAFLWWWQRHRRPGRTARVRSLTPAPSARTGHSGRSTGRTGRGGLFSRGRGSGGRTGGQGATPSGRRTGSRWSPFNGASRRAGKTAGRSGGQGADGSRAGRSRGLRSLLPGRRGTASGSAAKGRGAGRTGGGRSGAGSPRSAAGVPGGRWSRSRANPATWWGPQGASARAARKSARRRKEQPKSDKEAPASTKRTEKKTGTESGKRRWWRRKKTPAKGTAEKPTTAEDTAANPDAAPKPAAAPKPKKAADRAKPTATTTTHAPQHKAEPKAAPKPADVKGDVLVFDQWGFPTRPNPGPRPAPNQHIDDRFHQPKTMTITKAPKATKGSNTMSDRASNPYAHLIDSSSNASFRASTREAAEQARRDATKLQDDADELKRQAQSWIEKGSDDIAAPLLREASGMEQDAANRFAAAAAYESV